MTKYFGRHLQTQVYVKPTQTEWRLSLPVSYFSCLHGLGILDAWSALRTIFPAPVCFPSSVLILYSHLCQSDFFHSSFRLTFCRVLYHLSYACYLFRPSHLLWFDDPHNIRWREQIAKLLIMQFSPASCYFNSSRTRYSPLHFASNMLNLFSSLRNQNSLKHECWHNWT
jgi:hypothetical protein